MYHGFVRTQRGHMTTFDVSGAGTGVFQGTLPFGSNPEGAIAGFYADSSYVYHGFVRAPDGHITTFGAPGAGTGANQGTFTEFLDCINPEGAMTGYYVDINNELHGYVRARDGKITIFDAPGAGTGAGLGTLATGIDPASRIVGEYFDASNVSHGFVRAAHGDIINVDAPGAGSGSNQGTYQGISTREETLWEITWTPAASITASCAASGVKLPPSMFRARAAVAARAPYPAASTRREELRDSMWTPAMCHTASCLSSMSNQYLRGNHQPTLLSD